MECNGHVGSDQPTDVIPTHSCHVVRRVNIIQEASTIMITSSLAIHENSDLLQPLLGAVGSHVLFRSVGESNELYNEVLHI